LSRQNLGRPLDVERIDALERITAASLRGTIDPLLQPEGHRVDRGFAIVDPTIDPIVSEACPGNSPSSI
jgi:hypothetical protein